MISPEQASKLGELNPKVIKKLESVIDREITECFSRGEKIVQVKMKIFPDGRYQYYMVNQYLNNGWHVSAVYRDINQEGIIHNEWYVRLTSKK